MYTHAASLSLSCCVIIISIIGGHEDLNEGSRKGGRTGHERMWSRNRNHRIGSGGALAGIRGGIPTIGQRTTLPLAIVIVIVCVCVFCDCFPACACLPTYQHRTVSPTIVLALLAIVAVIRRCRKNPRNTRSPPAKPTASPPPPSVTQLFCIPRAQLARETKTNIMCV